MAGCDVFGNSRQDTISGCCVDLGQDTISCSCLTRTVYNIKDLKQDTIQRYLHESGSGNIQLMSLIYVV